MTTKQWLDRKIKDYNESPQEVMQEMLINTTSVIEQYIESPSKASKGLLGAALFHNKIFLEQIDKIEQQ